MAPQPALVHRLSSPASKIALFRSLFRGRDDVYPRRFESRRTGKSGYQPACANEWVRGVCQKPKVKCTDCSEQKFLPVTDEAIGWHLSGRDAAGRDFVMGVYPLLLDETCFFLAADFDKAAWQEDARAVLETCCRLGVPAALERSRSGKGGHIWLFFAEAIPAALARRLGAHILTETMEFRPDVGLDSYDRFFPNQDTLPHAGLGNLIALPLQRRPRDRGSSVFLDDSGAAHPDQWAFLSTVEKIDRATVERIAHDAERRGRIVGVRMASLDDEDAAPWAALPSRRRQEPPIAGPLPESLELILGDQVYIAKDRLPPGLRNRLVRLAAFQNPEFYKAQAMRLPTYDKPRIIGCAEDLAHHIGLPRGCLEDVENLLSDLGIAAAVRDERNAGSPLEARFHGELLPEQKIAARAMLAHETGVLCATTAFGKTVVAAWLIAQRGVNTLVLVHRRQLLEQWVERLAAFLHLPPKTIGRIGGGHRKPTGSLDVALIQSLVRKGVVQDCVGDYGQLIVDECHHLSARSFEQVARRARARFVTGLSATVARKDGHHPILFMQCGPVRHRVDAKAQADARPFAHVVLVRPTSFRPLKPADPDMRIQFHELYGELIADGRRNEAICDEVVRAVREGRSPLVLTERNEHLDNLAARLSPGVRHLVVLRGGARPAEARSLATRLAAIPENEERVLLATGRYVGEGFDDARLDTLFLTLPVSWRGTIAQYVGRLHRLNHRKREVRVYDYADLDVPMLARMFDRRCRGYEAVGYTVMLPASAVPGWPAEAPLPVDPQWKQDYAATVRRLVRDGVDPPLANLFVHAAGEVSPHAEGIERARSATEAFLYQRLETLSETAGLFRLNAELPIPFDGRGRMEVDLLAADERIAIEIDGGQHLGDAEAYRRDRRKDLLLQENGYLVLRFLAEDAGKRLDAVLDAILRALARRRGRTDDGKDAPASDA
ncbi:MAG: DEAD/DEAH box helicase family protein [Pirellulales bacterium]|jgi:superfamily II DNA or RNA helicase/very-short-patch-repair endonuclease|nr:DEAD/DEAH box helicase family protein [Thermoguttaceae bacterium]MDD4785647.1 DEAD/DEAH box helicase family protein [Pirellulales bacterium]MDI9442663.1 DEAD/DEAH box helicase family protein [Planctomycetota bacterium]NLZ02982.1 DEAD/DEAH box helicase family protein [Pirellulaceae bacterium]